MNFSLGLSSMWQAAAWGQDGGSQGAPLQPCILRRADAEMGPGLQGTLCYSSQSMPLIQQWLHCSNRSFLSHLTPHRCHGPGELSLQGAALWAAQVPAWASALWSRELDTGFHAAGCFQDTGFHADVLEEDNPHVISFKVFPLHCCSQLPPGKFLFSQKD